MGTTVSLAINSYHTPHLCDSRGCDHAVSSCVQSDGGNLLTFYVPTTLPVLKTNSTQMPQHNSIAFMRLYMELLTKLTKIVMFWISQQQNIISFSLLFCNRFFKSLHSSLNLFLQLIFLKCTFPTIICFIVNIYSYILSYIYE